MLKNVVLIMTVTSLVLCVATTCTWTRSFWRQDVWVMNRSGVQRVLRSDCGLLTFSSVRAHDNAGNPVLEDRRLGWESLAASNGRPVFTNSPTWQRVLGFGYHQTKIPGTTAGTWWADYRSFNLYFAVLPCIYVYKLSRKAWKSRTRLARQRRGLCGTCGYDLRETPKRCPECGEIAHHGTTGGNGSYANP